MHSGETMPVDVVLQRLAQGGYRVANLVYPRARDLLFRHVLHDPQTLHLSIVRPTRRIPSLLNTTHLRLCLRLRPLSRLHKLFIATLQASRKIVRAIRECVVDISHLYSTPEAAIRG
jgi:hypothetical protein